MQATSEKTPQKEQEIDCQKSLTLTNFKSKISSKIDLREILVNFSNSGILQVIADTYFRLNIYLD